MATKGDYEAKNEFLDDNIRNSMAYVSREVNLCSLKEKYNLHKEKEKSKESFNEYR